MANVDYIEIRGPASLAELVAAIDPTAPKPDGDVINLSLGGQEYAAIQYDQVDASTWPYMITVESRTDDQRPVRKQSTRLFALLEARGWNLRLTSDSSDLPLREGGGR